VSRQGRITQFLFPVLSGVLFALAFPSVDAGYLAWIALVPLLVAISDRSPRDAFIFGYVTGLVGFALILSWMRLFGVIPWMLLAAYLALYIGIFAALLRWLIGDRSPLWSLLLAPVLWTGLEYVRSIGPLGFPWATLGVSQHAFIPVLRVASITGVYGISALVALVNAWVATTVIHTRSTVEIVSGRPQPLRAKSLLIGIAVIVALIAFIWWMIFEPPRPEAGLLKVATLQPNVPPPLKFDPAVARNNMALLKSLIDQAAQTPTDLIVMPESALPSDLFGEQGLLPVVGGWAAAARSTLIATSLENGTSNIAVSIAPSGSAVDRYDKSRLVAFAESGIRPGFRSTPLWTPLGPLGVAICFESIFPEVSRDLVRAGAQAIVVITNDAWSDGTGGPAQHARFAPLRAVETGRWVVQAANSGVSLIVDPSGRIAASLPVQQPGVLVGRIAFERPMTPYVRWGDWFAQLMLAAAAAATMLRRDTLLAEIRRPAFRTAAAVCALPLTGVAALVASGAPWWAWTVLLLGFAAVFAAGRIAPAAPESRRGFRGLPAALAAGSLLVAALWGVVVLAFRANQIPVEITVPREGEFVLQQLLIAAALELWLRGGAFTVLAAWRGVPVAIGVTTLVGMVVQLGLPAEALAWAMVTGIGFGLIRARTGSAIGLIVPHALGNLLIAFLTVVR
jgi:apolipoprotein N-acyltransferase